MDILVSEKYYSVLMSLPNEELGLLTANLMSFIVDAQVSADELPPRVDVLLSIMLHELHEDPTI